MNLIYSISPPSGGAGGATQKAVHQKIKMKTTIQVAIVNNKREDEDRKDFVKLAQFMGMVHMRHFKIYDDAIIWLLGGKDIFK